MILPLLFSITLAGQAVDSNRKSKEIELEAISILEKEWASKKNTNICVIICYGDSYIVPVDTRAYDYIAVVSENLKTNKLSINYISFGENGIKLKKALVKIISGFPFSRMKGMVQFSLPKPEGWGDENIVDDLLNSPIQKRGEYYYSTDGGNWYYVGINFKDKKVITFKWLQEEENWTRVLKLIGPIENAVYKHAHALEHKK